jgi:hypothetical protein
MTAAHILIAILVAAAIWAVVALIHWIKRNGRTLAIMLCAAIAVWLAIQIIPVVLGQ